VYKVLKPNKKNGMPEILFEIKPDLNKRKNPVGRILNN
jgi:hypothetical protein